MVTDLVTAVPTATSPNCMEDVLRLSAAADVEFFDAFSWMEMLREDPFAVADMVAVCALETAVAFAVNEAVLLPATMVALAGTVRALLVLASATTRAFDDFALRDTEHAVFPAPVKDVVAQESDFSSGAPTAVVAGEREMENDSTVLP